MAESVPAALDKDSAHRRFAAQFPAEREMVAVIRREMAAIASECGLDEAGVADVKLAASEAASNVVLHAYREQDGQILVEAYYRDGELLIAIGDRGQHGMAPRIDSPGFGLGLPLIASVTSRVEMVSEGTGTEIQMVFPCPAGVSR